MSEPSSAPRLERSLSARWAGLVLLVWPLVLLACDRRWIFGGIGRDEWIYYGYFRFARIYLAEFAGLYYSSRLSVILPGYCTRHLLPPLAAAVFLHLVLFWLAAGGFYVVARAFAGRRAALLASLVLTSQPYFLCSIGWNYVDGFGITYFLLAAACVVLAARRSAWRPGLLAGAGALAIAIVSANLFYSIYLPILAAIFLAAEAQARSAREGPRSARERLRSAREGPRNTWHLVLRDLGWAFLWVSVGAAVAFGALATVGHFWGHGPLSFLGASIGFLSDFSRKPSPFKRPAELWLGRAFWLCFPLVVLGGSVVAVVRGLRTRPPGIWLALFPQLQYLALFVLMSVVELGPQGVTFQEPYYASLLLPSAGLALANQLAPLLAGMRARSFAILVAGSTIGLGLTALGDVVTPSRPLRPELSLSSAVIALLPVVVGLGGLFVAGSGRRGLGPAFLFLGLLAGSHFLVQSLGRIQERRNRHPGGAPDRFLQIDRTLTALAEVDPGLHLRLWYDQNEDRLGLYDATASALLLCPHLVTTTFPDPRGGRMCDGKPLRPGLTIAVLSERPEAPRAALASLASVGLRAHLLRRTAIPGPAPAFAVTFLVTDP